MTAIPNPASVESLGELLRQEEAAARDALASGRSRGPVTGFPKLDKQLGGFLAPGINTILASPGSGKTALAGQIAGQCGCPALFVTVEMRPVEILRRTIARETSTYLARLRGGELSDEDLQHRLRTTSESIPQFAIYDATHRFVINPSADPRERILNTDVKAIQFAAMALKERFESDHVLIVMDSLTDWATANMESGDTEYTTTEKSLNALKELTAALACPLLMIVHRNRVGNKESTGDNQLFSGKASGRIEYVSETVWTLETVKGKGDVDINGQTLKEITMNKNRYGILGAKVQYLFEGRIQKFEEA